MSSKKETGIQAALRPPYEILAREIVRDPTISYRSLGIAVRLLSNAPGFTMDSLDLAGEGPGREGRDAVRTALKELESAGYLKRVRSQRQNGQWSTTSTISDTKRAAQYPETLHSTQSETESHALGYESPSIPKPAFQSPALPCAAAGKPRTGNPVVGDTGANTGGTTRNIKSTTTTAGEGNSPTAGTSESSAEAASSQNEETALRSASQSHATYDTCTIEALSGLIWPTQVKLNLNAAKDILAGLNIKQAQEIFDELEGTYVLKKPPLQTYGWLKACVARMKKGEFNLDTGKHIAKMREQDRCKDLVEEQTKPLTKSIKTAKAPNMEKQIEYIEGVLDILNFLPIQIE